MQRYYMIENGKPIQFSDKPIKGDGSLMVLDDTQIDHEKVILWYIASVDDKGDLVLIPTPEMQIDIINKEFDKKIQSYNSKYAEEEQKRFSDKLIKAEKVVNWWSDDYITAIAKNLGISATDFANIIIVKAKEFETFYIQSEIERDTAISNL